MILKGGNTKTMERDEDTFCSGLAGWLAFHCHDEILDHTGLDRKGDRRLPQREKGGATFCRYHFFLFNVFSLDFSLAFFVLLDTRIETNAFEFEYSSYVSHTYFVVFLEIVACCLMRHVFS